jgi:predicted phosphoribosyltransferase/dienelactone hydrolase
MQYEDISISNVNLKGVLNIPPGASALILFIHGSGSDRFSIRNKYLSCLFNKNGFATLLIDLLTEDEKKLDQVYKTYRFDLDLLTKRVVGISDWIMHNPKTKNMPIGYFSSSTGSVAALKASLHSDNIRTIIAKSGRLDLLDNSTKYKLKIPILLIVGGRDSSVVKMNKIIYDELKGYKLVKFSVIPYASHFFEEEGKLNDIFVISQNWYRKYLLNEKQKFNFHFIDYQSRLKAILDLNNKLIFKFQDRSSAGFVLANLLKKYDKDPDVVIIGIPKGGIVVADAIAIRLSINSLDFVLSRRIKDQQSDDTIGSTIEDGSLYLSNRISISREDLDNQISRQKTEINASLKTYGSKHFPSKWMGKKLILVDDGAFTGSSAILAYKYIKNFEPSEIMIALPVLSKEAYELLHRETNKIVFIYRPKNFKFVENYYKNYDQVDENVVLNILMKYS